MYREYLPDIQLSHLIDTYWVTDGIVEESFSQRILPDGCVDIIFDFGSNDGNSQNKTGLPNLVGTMTSMLEITYQIGRVEMMGIRFLPGGITALTKIPAFEFTNQNTIFPLTDTLLDHVFYEQLPDMDGMQRISYLNKYFIARLDKLYLPDKQINHAVSCVKKYNGQLNMQQLAGEVCLSERQFERKFKGIVGISPKVFSNVIRFRYTESYLKSHPDESIYNIAYTCGYYDHSHLIRDYKRFAGNLPRKI